MADRPSIKLPSYSLKLTCCPPVAVLDPLLAVTWTSSSDCCATDMGGQILVQVKVLSQAVIPIPACYIGASRCHPRFRVKQSTDVSR